MEQEQELIKLRQTLHQYPELSGYEEQTAQMIKAFLSEHTSATFIEHIGGHGLAAIFDFAEPGPTVMIRCELDALPIQEGNNFEHRSRSEGVSHKCGHDGHMTIVAGLAKKLNEEVFLRGRAVLLFQPAEENGQGAHAVMTDPKFESIEPDFIFSLHNIPGFEHHTVIQVDNTFSPTVQSVVIYLEGKECHAAQPDEGINPAAGIAEILSSLTLMNNHDPLDDLFAVLTPVHVTMGQKAYGLSPGKAELHYTLRSWTEEVMAGMKAHLQEIVANVCDIQELSYRLEWLEYFPATNNTAQCNDLVAKVALKNNLNFHEKEYPFRFGEDFGWFSRNYKSAMFGLGAGVDTPALHHDTYDFPDEIIPTGLTMFIGLIEEVLS